MHLPSFTILTLVAFLAHNSFANDYKAESEPKIGIPLTTEGVETAQDQLSSGNVLNSKTKALDKKYNLPKLQEDAYAATSTYSDQQRRDQFDLGATILPFVAPWISEIAQECMSKVVIENTKESASKAAECSNQAVKKFQENPSAFLSRLPASEREKLEALVKQKIADSARPNKIQP